MNRADPTARRLALAGLASLVLPVHAAAPAGGGALPKPPPGQPGDFDFLAGRWTIRHRRRPPGAKDWDVFGGEATCWTILGGVGSVEELRIPERDFSGMGLRLLDVANRTWNDYWVNGKHGVLAPPGLAGGFNDGVGTFSAEDRDGEGPMIVRGVWDRITPGTCRWHQAVSRDGGRTWQENWFMDWTRA